ncbi:MAG TPA: maleylacetoacetate isomerase [Polyangiaceae bacterium]
MILHTYWRSSSAYRVRIALGLKGIAYESHCVHLVRSGGQQHLPTFHAKNPREQVPVLELELGGKTVFLAQSLAIIEYLEERFPTPPLLPRETFARARVRECAELVNSGIQPFQNTGTLNFLAEVAPELDKVRWCQHFIGLGLSSLETRARDLSGRFLVGEDVSIADVLLVPQLYAARRMQVALEAFPTLLRVEAQCSKLDGFAAAHPDRQPDRE